MACTMSCCASLLCTRRVSENLSGRDGERMKGKIGWSENKRDVEGMW